MATKHRILTIAHAHPDFSLGGGELAAYNLLTLIKPCKRRGIMASGSKLKRAGKHRRDLTGKISKHRPNEYLWEQAVYDWHMMKAAHQQSLKTDFTNFIQMIKPTIIHTHHYSNLGLEYLSILKQINPEVRIYMTFTNIWLFAAMTGK